MAITIINQKSIVEINAEKEELKSKDEAITKLGRELAMEKAKSMQKDLALQGLGSEVAVLKIEVMKIKGGIK